jgi:hypothetical protein
VEGRDNGTETLKSDGSSLEGLSIAHLKSIHEYGAVSVRVNFEFHGD